MCVSSSKICSSSILNMPSSSSSACPRLWAPERPAIYRSALLPRSSESWWVKVGGCMPKGLYIAVSQLLATNLPVLWYRSGSGGAGGTSGEPCGGLERGGPKFRKFSAAASPPSSLPDVPGRDFPGQRRGGGAWG